MGSDGYCSCCGVACVSSAVRGGTQPGHGGRLGTCLVLQQPGVSGLWRASSSRAGRAMYKTLTQADFALSVDYLILVYLNILERFSFWRKGRKRPRMELQVGGSVEVVR